MPRFLAAARAICAGLGIAGAGAAEAAAAVVDEGAVTQQRVDRREKKVAQKGVKLSTSAEVCAHVCVLCYSNPY